MTKEVQKWADKAMFKAEESDATKGIEVFLLQGTPDPLGSVAAFSAMYTGKVIRDKRDVTDEERRYHLKEMQATKLKAPLEAVNLHFMVEGVTRSFTHQMVRQRTAVYAQESLRFAVKEDAASAVALPPFLAGTMSTEEWAEDVFSDFDLEVDDPQMHPEFGRYDEQQQMRLVWDYEVRNVSDTYNHLVNLGMPAEDARGLLPHAITTRLNYATNLRNLQDHSGNRLCTQAQFEWRMFWVKATESMRNYCTSEVCRNIAGVCGTDVSCDNWQWQEIANLFRPVCYFTGKCEFQAEFDRACTIRGRVQENHSEGRGSENWGQDYDNGRVFIGAIHPSEWLLDHNSARVAE